jgi:hypothetical protein
VFHFSVLRGRGRITIPFQSNAAPLPSPPHSSPKEDGRCKFVLATPCAPESCARSPDPAFKTPTSSDKSGSGDRLHHDRGPNIKAKKGAKRRETDRSISAPAGAAARSKSERARLSAFHHGSRQAVHYLLTQLQARLPGTWSERALPAPSCPSPGSYRSKELLELVARAGRSAGGHDARSRPKASYEFACGHRARSLNRPSPVEIPNRERDLLGRVAEPTKDLKFFWCPN